MEAGSGGGKLGDGGGRTLRGWRGAGRGGRDAWCTTVAAFSPDGKQLFFKNSFNKGKSFELPLLQCYCPGGL